MKTRFLIRLTAAALTLLAGIATAQAGELGAEATGRDSTQRQGRATVLPTDVLHLQAFGRGSPEVRTPARRTLEAGSPGATPSVERFGRA